MGSLIEFNDTLELTLEQGFPDNFVLERHLQQPYTTEEFKDRIYEFHKPNMRLYHPAPTRVFLVHNIDGKWIHWGKAHVLEQTIHAETKSTSGKFRLVQIYEPEFMRMKNIVDVSKEKQYSFPY